jgi:hypothetical protein
MTGTSAFFGPWVSPINGAANNTQTNATVVVNAGTLSNFRVFVNEAPQNGGGTQSLTITVLRNGVDTGVACTISETQTQCADTTAPTSETFNAGDTLVVRVTANSTGGPNVTVDDLVWVADFG